MSENRGGQHKPGKWPPVTEYLTEDMAGEVLGTVFKDVVRSVQFWPYLEVQSLKREIAKKACEKDFFRSVEPELERIYPRGTDAASIARAVMLYALFAVMDRRRV